MTESLFQTQQKVITYIVERPDEDLNQISDGEREEFSEKLCDYDSSQESAVEIETFTEDNEDNMETCAVDMDTMLDDCDPIVPLPDEPIVPHEFTFAPGDGQVPVSVFKDDNAEYLAFPTIFCGQKRPDNREWHQKVHHSDICKYEL